ncbi:MAG TPA: response regulator [Polyangia bacterium]|nr:response regulator [Polyangia bacterium]
MILLIEDDFILRKSLAEFLNEEGFDVECAADGREGLRRLASTNRRRPSLILLDMIMPRMSGPEFCMQQKATPDQMKIPLIAISAVAFREQDLGFLGLKRAFQKPLDPPEMLTALWELASPSH